MISFACSTICFRTQPLETALAEVAAAGFDCVELALLPGFCDHFDAVAASEADLERLLRTVRGSRLRLSSVAVNPGFFNARGADRHRIVETGIAWLRVAAMLGARAVNVRCGEPIQDRAQFREHATLQARGLARLAQAAADLGLRLQLEAPHRNGLCRTLDEAAWLLEAIGEPNVKALLDTSHVQAGGATPEQAVAFFGERLAHVHLRDARGQDIFVVPGEGAVDFAAFFASLARRGFKGDCSLELEGHGETLVGRRAAVVRAIRFLAREAEAVRGWRAPSFDGVADAV